MGVASGSKRIADHCVYCGVRMEYKPYRKKDADGVMWTLDHLVPASEGGSVAVPSCMACNDAKGSKRPMEFLSSHWLEERREFAKWRRRSTLPKSDEWFELLVQAETMV